MSNNYKKIHFPEMEYFKDISNITNITFPVTSYEPDYILTEKFIFFLQDSIGVILKSVVIIYYPESVRDSNIHIDNYDRTDQASLNFIINNKKSKINWYKPIDGYYGEISYNDILVRKRDFNIRYLNLIESIEPVDWHLFQIGVPHNIIKLNNEPRWCVSIKIKTPTDKYIPWQDAVNIFKNYIND